MIELIKERIKFKQASLAAVTDIIFKAKNYDQAQGTMLIKSVIEEEIQFLEMLLVETDDWK